MAADDANSQRTDSSELSSVDISKSQGYWKGIIDATKTPLGLYALVLLVINASLLIIVARGSVEQGVWIALPLVGLAFLLVIVVAFLEIKKQTPANRNVAEIRIFLGAPAKLAQLDLSLIEWDDKKCFLIIKGKKESVRLVHARIGPVFQVEIDRQILSRLRPAQAIALELKDKKGNDWRVPNFYPYDNFVQLALGESPEKIIRDYGDPNQ